MKRFWTTIGLIIASLAMFAVRAEEQDIPLSTLPPPIKGKHAPRPSIPVETIVPEAAHDGGELVVTIPHADDVDSFVALVLDAADEVIEYADADGDNEIAFYGIPSGTYTLEVCVNGRWFYGQFTVS